MLEQPWYLLAIPYIIAAVVGGTLWFCTHKNYL